MAYAFKSRNPNSFDPRSLKLDFNDEADEWRRDPENGRDIKKYILMLGLGALSWVATYIGMLELIQANLGALPFTHKVVIGFSVAMLMVMIIWLLDQMFKPHAGAVKLAYVGGYLFLTLISVGFGFGFYWKVLESRTEASRSAESAVSQVQNSLNGASVRLEQLQATLAQLAEVSEKKSELERTKGTSCPNSRPGDGPRRKMRAADAAKFSFASEFVAGRVGAIKQDMKTLDGDLSRIAKKDQSIIDPKSGTRNAFMRQLGRKLDLTVTGFNAFRTDPQLKQLRSDLQERANKTVFKASGGKTFACPDPQLQQALRGAVRALDQLPVLDKPKIAVVEGSEATIEAFRRLTATLQGALTFQLPPSADELRDLQQKAIRQAVSKTEQAKLQIETAGLSSRDYVPLAIAIFVDLCLLLVSMGRATNRIENLVPKMRAAERGPVIEILSRFKDIHRDPQVRDNFEVFRHVVFDQNGDYYVAVPLDAPYTGAPRGYGNESYGTEQAQELQHEAHLLANLFTSFEKERIFRRVYNPLLLNTRAIQKRLARQGSKFAGCEAFRVYKFRDGAWSEIILGAVMGAARRAETKRRRTELERGLFGTPATPDADRGPANVDPDLDDAAVLADTLTANARGQTETAAFDLFKTQPTSETEPTVRARPMTAGAAPRSRAQTEKNRSVTAEQAAKYGPYALHVGDDELADVDVRQPGATDPDAQDEAHTEPALTDGLLAHSNGVAAKPAALRVQEARAQADAMENDTADISHPLGDVATDMDAELASPITTDAVTARTPATTTEDATLADRTNLSVEGPLSVNATLTPEQHVDVVFTRDTATVSVPVTEATLPNGVARLMRDALAAANADLAHGSIKTVEAADLGASEPSQDHSVEPPDVIALPAYDAPDIEHVDETGELHDGDEVSRLASRFAAHTDGPNGNGA